MRLKALERRGAPCTRRPRTLAEMKFGVSKKLLPNQCPQLSNSKGRTGWAHTLPLGLCLAEEGSVEAASVPSGRGGEYHVAAPGPGMFYSHSKDQTADTLLHNDVRLFAFVRFTTGDAMSKRSKFALITWIGENVSGLQRAKTGTDKTLVKEVVQNFAKEFVISDRKELEEDFIKNELKKAGGANYDAQTE
ncbi:PREDICTED: coactosin-like protein [Dipodomys ordii]|uniref:Coactosin-like protein n=1 Tax=Dipodomys ordii TaxID=10020 RepID=A0A1S3EUR8_DIPOR|nr:PREDICTED: coactosin-like protein [Dipodomys ordii]